MKDYAEMRTDDVDKVIRIGEYDYIIKNCKTEEELKCRLCDALLTDVRVAGKCDKGQFVLFNRCFRGINCNCRMLGYNNRKRR